MQIRARGNETDYLTRDLLPASNVEHVHNLVTAVDRRRHVCHWTPKDEAS